MIGKPTIIEPLGTGCAVADRPPMRIAAWRSDAGLAIKVEHEEGAWLVDLPLSSRQLREIGLVLLDLADEFEGRGVGGAETSPPSL